MKKLKKVSAILLSMTLAFSFLPILQTIAKAKPVILQAAASSDTYKTVVACHPESSNNSDNIRSYTVDFQVQTLGVHSIANLQSITYNAKNPLNANLYTNAPYMISVSDYTVKVNGRLDPGLKISGVDSYVVDFQAQTANGKALANLQSLKLSIDMSVLKLVRWNGNEINLSSLSTMPVRLPDDVSHALSGWTGSLYAALSTDGKRLLVQMEPSRAIDPFDNPNGYPLPELTALQSLRLALLPGKTLDDLTANSIRLMNLEELVSTNQSEQILLNDGNITVFRYGSQVGGKATPERDIFYEPPIMDILVGTYTGNAKITGQIRSYNPKLETTVALYKTGTNIIVASKTLATTNGFGTIVQEFELPSVPEGVYDLKISKPIHLSYTLTGIIVGSDDLDLTINPDNSIKTITLPCGDINDDGLINDRDLTELWKLSNYNRSVNDEGVNESCDLNGDGMINDVDLTILWLISNYNKAPVIITP